MSIQTWFSQFTKTVTKRSKVVAIVQPDGVYFSGHELAGLPAYIALSQSWQETLLAALQAADAKEIGLDLVLHSSFYHTYQIEKPNVPPAEWPGALPFLLKDLTTEKMANIVAQAVLLPYGNRIQCYVISKALILDVVRRLTERNIQLDRVLVEDDVWAHVPDMPAAFLLLQRSKNSQYKVSALVAGTCVFQRTIRGVTSPLVGGMASELQLDSIALELQRSLDYLSSQLKGITIHQMKICCDDEDCTLLANELDQRLSVKAAPLTAQSNLCGAILADTAWQDNDFQINLYLDALKPKKEHLGLATVLAGWGIAALALLVVWAWLGMEQRQLNQHLAQLNGQQIELKAQSEQLTAQLAKHQPSPEKVAAVGRLKLDIKASQAALASLKSHQSDEQLGFSGVMAALANISRQDISLNYIKMDGQSFTLKGLAKTPDSVPSWIKQFKQELNLVGRAFDTLSIGRNPQQLVTFELTTKRESK